MQTFLPYPDFAETAAVLDSRRLGKQRVEVLQILRALTFDDYGWRTHPAVKMWAGFTEALVAYGAAQTRRWRDVGHTDTVMPQLLEFLGTQPLRRQGDLAALGLLPPWMGWEPLHRSHRAALVRKDPDHYGPLFPDADPQTPYVWPESEPAAVDTAPVSAWVVRATPSDAAAMRRASFVGVRPADGEDAEHPQGRSVRNTKRRRQISVFVHTIRENDRVAVPCDERLLVGEVAGGYQWWPQAPLRLHHSRQVRWLGEVRREQLARPFHLQDPRTVFALRDEPVLAGR